MCKVRRPSVRDEVALHVLGNGTREGKQPINGRIDVLVVCGSSSIPRRFLNSAFMPLPRNNRNDVWGRPECGGAR